MIVLLAAVVILGSGANSQFAPLSQLFNTPASGSSGFISVSDAKSFVDQLRCTEFVPLGFNAYTDVVYAAKLAAANVPLPVVSLAAQTDPVAAYFKTASDAGFNTVRIFGHGNASFQLQNGPGAYDESVFKAFDYIIAQAGFYKIKVIFVVINNWLDQSIGGGKLKYCQWAGLSNEDLFWSDPGAMQLVKNHLSALANRKNTFTGVVYNQDPAILYWELFYEPRCPASQQGAGCPGPVTSWYDTMAQYMRTQDTHHLISTGEEGFFAVNSSLVNADPWGIPASAANQGRYWAGNLGQDFEEQHRRASIDVASFQMWPDRYATQDPAFPAAWIGNHTSAARMMGKPLVLEEVGRGDSSANESARVAMFQLVFDALQASLASKDSLKGVLFWRWPIDNTSIDYTTIAPGQPTFALIQSQVAKLQSYTSNPLAGCGTQNVNILAFTQSPTG